MKTNCSNRRNRALTLVEVLLVLFIIFVLVALLLPVLAMQKRKSNSLSCDNNLKQVGLAFRLWEGDNGGKYPMDVSVTNGGVMELVVTGNAMSCFQVMSNQLSTPKILICPVDTDRVTAADFSSGFFGANISYYVGVDASESNPQMFLSGDDNFKISGVPIKSGLLKFSTNAPIAWTTARHNQQGNIGLADGSVLELTGSGLIEQLYQTGIVTNRLAIP